MSSRMAAFQYELQIAGQPQPMDVWLVGAGPLAGKTISLAKCQGDNTLTFSLRGQTGAYHEGRWRPQYAQQAT